MVEKVEVLLNGKIFSVNRAKLAENMQRGGRIARMFGRRPGEKTGGYLMPEVEPQMSEDALAIRSAIISAAIAEHAPELG